MEKENNNSQSLFAIQLLAEGGEWTFMPVPISAPDVVWVFDSLNSALAVGASVLTNVSRVKKFRVVEWQQRIFHDPIAEPDVKIGKRPDGDLPAELPDNVVKFERPNPSLKPKGL